MADVSRLRAACSGQTRACTTNAKSIAILAGTKFLREIAKVAKTSESRGAVFLPDRRRRLLHPIGGRR